MLSVSKAASCGRTTGSGAGLDNQASMWRAARLPCPTATVTERSKGTMSPPAKTPGQPVIMVRSDGDDAVLHDEPRHFLEQRQVGLLAESQHE